MIRKEKICEYDTRYNQELPVWIELRQTQTIVEVLNK